MYYLKLYQDRGNAVMVYKCGLLKQIIHLVSWKSWRLVKDVFFLFRHRASCNVRSGRVSSTDYATSWLYPGT